MHFYIDLIEFNNNLFGRNYGSYKIEGINGLVYGKNGQHDIPVNSVFNRARKTSKVGNEQLFELELQLESVDFYQKSIDVIPGGHTAKLRISGNNLDMLSQIINNLEEGESVRIEA